MAAGSLLGRALLGAQRSAARQSLACPHASFPAAQRATRHWQGSLGPCSRSLPARQASTASTSASSEDTYTGPPRLLVFGGNGFVGTRVCQQALETGLSVVSISRGGRPPLQADWVPRVDWVQADVFNTPSWRQYLKGAVGVVSCIGAFGSNDFMLKICGESNSSIFREASAAGVPRAAFVSVHDYNLPDFFLPGYFKGKRSAEQTLFSTFPQTGVAVRPGFMHGTRQVGSVGIPLSAVGVPLDKVLGLLPGSQLQSLASTPFVSLGAAPPVAVAGVAKALVDAATDPSVPPGIMDLWHIKQKYEG